MTEPSNSEVNIAKLWFEISPYRPVFIIKLSTLFLQALNQLLGIRRITP